MIIKLNSDKEKVEEIREALKKNEGYCPYKLEKIKENKCICQEFLNSKELGECGCGLYIKIEGEKSYG